MAFSDLLEQVGSTGRFQVLHVTLLSMPILMMASHNLLQNFVAAVPPHHCAPHANLSMSSMGAGDVLQATVPLGQNGKPERCRRYVHPQWQLLSSNSSESLWEEGVEEIETQSCEDGWYYNTTEMSSTIISEWDLVCDQRALKQMSQTTYMGGVLVGAVIFGGLSDRFVVEWIPTRVRTVVGTGTGYCYTTGQLILAALAYCIRDWRWLTLAVSLPFYVSFLYSCVPLNIYGYGPALSVILFLFDKQKQDLQNPILIFRASDASLCNFLLCPLSQNGMGWVSMMAQFGAMVAPMVLLLGEDSSWLPGFIYGRAPIISGIFAFFLPETLAQPLPDTIQEVDDRGFVWKKDKRLPEKEDMAKKDPSCVHLKESV
ncbi:solute carrier family 22 member 6-like [Sinocyclocheilus rhinocerous]|uniref:solute carrier family 22 member 6-like n=1 Tax=Sinocyclocheilus rhinocerous TaxID=307959 RepID=UPI0007BA104B|nr:PREDICTED: solute carrier family 22 member 6-like [Sinocyclocheilus rhinocerous]